jgi:hypothetical protein
LRLKVDAFKHIIGQDMQNAWLREQLSAVPVVPEPVAQHGRRLHLRLKFDYNDNTFQVINTNEEAGAIASVIWGFQKGEEVMLNFDEVLHLVNLKWG